ncbi:MAG: tetratricopeptide repeat protein [Gammaproteobacteria bacterium]|nr:tetratricopeptide repeat protein [Gammaproteobacteria bacterium]
MMRRRLASIPTIALTLCACAHAPHRGTLASLSKVTPDTREAGVHQGLDQAMQSYRAFLTQAPQSTLAPEAMRRLADLKIEKQYGILGDGKPVEAPAQSAAGVKAAAVPPLPPPAPTSRVGVPAARQPEPLPAGSAAWSSSSEQELEARAAAPQSITARATAPLPGAPAGDPERSGPLEAIRLYDELLAKYPSYQYADQVLYQKARAYDELGEGGKAMEVLEQLIRDYPHSQFADEVQFRRGEHFFVRRKYRDAEGPYSAIVAMGPGSEYYELALYKLGWTYYKEALYEEALREYFALLDFKVSKGYDFDAKHRPGEARRVEDTFQAVSLSFSNLGGPEVVARYFAANGHRGYEDRIYRYLGEYYLVKLRYHDSAAVYQSFVAQYPFNRTSPHFSMRVVEVYEKGGFPDLVLAAKKDFAMRYGLGSEYWRHVDIHKSPDVLSHLETNLTDLAHYYHAQYQNPKLVSQKAANFAEATRWYGQFLSSFHSDPQAPAINYQLADLLRENRDYADAARQYERTAYDYPAHPKAAAAGYEAVYAHRQYLAVATGPAKAAAARDTVTSSLEFADTFAQDPHAPVVLGAAAEDLYGMKDYTPARAAALKLIEHFPGAQPSVQRDAWLVIAHSSFELADYGLAEVAFTRVLAATPPADPAHPALVDNLAASIYQQGAQARTKGDYRTAADDFLRVKQAAPGSNICAAAEYDAGAAFVKLKDWTHAAQVFSDFRRDYPQNKLHKDATRQLAFVYRQAGQLGRAAGEYERVAAESQDPKLHAEALLAAGDLYEQSKDLDHALDVYTRYVAQFPKPIEAAEAARNRIAAIYQGRNDENRYDQELEEIVRVDATAGAERTDLTRTLAARSALTLTQKSYQQFAAIKLVQPFDQTLQQKQRDMKATLDAFGNLTAYGVADVTAAATFYIAETYANFGRSLRDSERPKDLSGKALQDYDHALAQQALPFEQKAIEVHQKNLELMRSGVYGPWIEKSLARLAALDPQRYDRPESSSGLLDSIDRYVYRVPPRPAAEVAAAPAAPHAAGATLAQAPVPKVPTAGSKP